MAHGADQRGADPKSRERITNPKTRGHHAGIKPAKHVTSSRAAQSIANDSDAGVHAHPIRRLGPRELPREADTSSTTRYGADSGRSHLLQRPGSWHMEAGRVTRMSPRRSKLLRVGYEKRRKRLLSRSESTHRIVV